MALEDILERCLDEVLQADETGRCPLCSSQISRSLGSDEIAWSCSKAGCPWRSGMSIGLYRDLIDEAGDGR